MEYLNALYLIPALALAFAGGWLFHHVKDYRRWFYLAFAVGFLLAAFGQLGCPICTLLGWLLVLMTNACQILVRFMDECHKKDVGIAPFNKG